jgi:hypothetical protein
MPRISKPGHRCLSSRAHGSQASLRGNRGQLDCTLDRLELTRGLFFPQASQYGPCAYQERVHRRPCLNTQIILPLLHRQCSTWLRIGGGKTQKRLGFEQDLWCLSKCGILHYPAYNPSTEPML